jgi:hypothetical protein
MKILVTGATGLIGRSLCRSLTGENHTVVALSRKPEAASNLSSTAVYKWDPLTGPPVLEALEGVDAVVHLAGEPIAAKRWSAEQKDRIRSSRVVSTRNLVEGLRKAAAKPASLISGSAVGFYGDRGDETLDERSPAGSGFLPELCSEWESEAERAEGLNVRVVRIRTGVVLSPEGGALKKMLPAFKLGVGGPLGGGRQWFPWIHISDMVGVLRHAISTSALSGPVNAAAPEPVTNAVFSRELGRVLHRPAFLAAPKFALRLALGEMADILLASQRVIPKAIEDAGYTFQFRTLGTALEDLLGKR